MKIYDSFPMKINEFRKLLNVLNIKAKFKVIYKLFKTFDTNNSGEIEIDEFYIFLQQWPIFNLFFIFYINVFYI